VVVFVNVCKLGGQGLAQHAEPIAALDDHCSRRGYACASVRAIRSDGFGFVPLRCRLLAALSWSSVVILATKQ
jgi:hypothetical protein